jgi:diguanylate cyclase (GGDEF)-like protein/PAS domain S-box-containing protein
LKARVALWSTAAMVAVTLAGTAIALWAVHDDARRAAITSQAVLIENIASDLDRQIEDRRSAVALSAAVLGALNLDTAAFHDHFTTRPVLTRMFDVVFVTDRQGVVRFDMPEFPGRVGRSVADRRYFREVMSTGRPVVSEPMAGKATSEPSIVIAAPMRDAKGDVVGVLGGILFLTRPNFLSQVGELRIGQSGYAALATKGARPTIVMHAQRERLLTPLPSPEVNPHVHRALQGFEGTVEAVNSAGLSALFTYRSLDTVPWVLMTAYPTSEAFAGLQGVMWRVAMVGCVFVLLAAGGIWWTMRRLLSPLDDLREAMVQARERNALVPAEVHQAAPELAQVAAAYNALMQHTQGVTAALQASEERLRAITDNVPALIGYFDRDERCRFANRTARRLQGEVIDVLHDGRLLCDIVGEDSYVQQEPAIRRALVGEPANVDCHIVRRGRDLYFRAHFIPDLAEDGSVRGFYTLSVDFTALKLAELQLADGERRLRTIADNLPALIAYVDDRERVQFVNETYRRWLGMDPARSVGKTLDQLSIASNPVREQNMQRALAGERVAFELTVQSPAGERHLSYVYIPDRRPDGRIAGVYALASDVTALKAVEQQLSGLARRDPLTGLLNRRGFDERLPDAMARSRRNERLLALMYLDVDHFKQINDSGGHHAGDAVLKEFAQRLLSQVRQTDTVARLAGDEFVVILEGLNSREEVTAIAAKLNECLRLPIVFEGHMLYVTASIGVALYEGGVAELDELIAQADAALYTAKRSGRNRFALAG